MFLKKVLEIFRKYFIQVKNISKNLYKAEE